MIFQDDEFEELFYENVQNLLRERLIFQDNKSLEFMKVFRNFDNKAVLFPNLTQICKTDIMSA